MGMSAMLAFDSLENLACTGVPELDGLVSARCYEMFAAVDEKNPVDAKIVRGNFQQHFFLLPVPDP